MADTKEASPNATLNAGERVIRTYEEALAAPAEPPVPTQEECDAIKLGEYVAEGESADAASAKKKRAEERKEREAKAAADKQAGYQTR